jgi:hypothetical protein
MELEYQCWNFNLRVYDAWGIVCSMASQTTALRLATAELTDVI